MNKNLESEYQNMIRAEVPDIWDRIEAKIDAQEAQKKVVPFKKKNTRWKYYVIPAAAALLCVAIAVPVMFNAKNASTTAMETAATSQPASAGGLADMTDSAAYAEEYDSVEDEAETDYALAIDPEYEKDNKGNGEGKQAFTVAGDNSTYHLVTNGSTLGEAAEAECAPEEDDHTEEADEDVNADDRVIRIEVDGQMTEDGVEELAGMLGLKIYSSEGAGDYVLIGENGISDELLAQAIRVFKENVHIKNMQVDKLPLK